MSSAELPINQLPEPLAATRTLANSLIRILESAHETQNRTLCRAKELYPRNKIQLTKAYYQNPANQIQATHPCGYCLHSEATGPKVKAFNEAARRNAACKTSSAALT